jgi:transposase
MIKQKIKRKVSKRREIKLTKKQKEALILAEKQAPNPQVLKRIQCILLKDKGWTHRDVAEHLNKGFSTVSDYVKIYKKGGLKQLVFWGYVGKKPKLSSEQIIELKQKINESHFNVAQEAADFIKEKFDVDYNVKYLPRLLKKTDCLTKSLV